MNRHSKQLLIALLLSEAFIFSGKTENNKKNVHDFAAMLKRVDVILAEMARTIVPHDSYVQCCSKDGNDRINKLFGTYLPVKKK